MNRRNFIKWTGLTLGGLALIPSTSFAAFLSANEGKIRMLTKDTGIYLYKGGTILFQWNKAGIVVVDTQFPDTAKDLLQQLKERTNSTPALLINTHHHGDHTAGNIVFKDLVETVIAHENALKYQKIVAQKNNNEPQQLYPNLTFTDTLKRKFGSENIHLKYFGPAHTSGDIVVHFKNANIVHMGDLVFNRRFPYIDKDSGANIQNWIQVLDKITKEYGDKTHFVCGHAGEGYDVIITKKDIKAFQQYLQNALDFVAAEIKDGKIREEILSAKTIPGSPEWKGEGIERTLSAAYNELTEKFR